VELELINEQQDAFGLIPHTHAEDSYEMIHLLPACLETGGIVKLFQKLLDLPSSLLSDYEGV
jgi:hypothetical protein